jgi:predicted dehydrogenase
MSRNSKVVAISSRDLARAQKCAQELDIPRAYGSYEEVLSDPDIDAIINPLPNSMHCEWTVKAAEAGKHIICEKPLAVTVEQAEEMIATAKANGVLLVEGFTPRYEPQIDFALDLLNSGAIGDPKIIRSELTYTIQDWENDTRVKPDLAGGSLLDAGCYCVNIIRHLMGVEPVSVLGYQRIHPSAGVDSTFTGMMEFPNGCLGFIATGMEQPFRACCEITGTEGRIEIPAMFGGGKVKVVKQQGEEIHTFESVNRFLLQVEHFSDCIISAAELRFPPEDGLANTKVLVSLKQAAESGCSVSIK